MALTVVTMPLNYSNKSLGTDASFLHGSDGKSSVFEVLSFMDQSVNEMTIVEINLLKPANSRVTALRFAESRKGRKYVFCKCMCGGYKEIIIKDMAIGHTLSCGCLQKKSISGFSKKYHNNVKAIHHAYFGMMARCYNPKCKSYKGYGERGVIVCEEWKNSYQSFLDWSLQNGWEQGLHLDKDIRGTGFLYSPETCSWVTRVENNNNRRGLVKYEYDGQILTLTAIGRLIGVSKGGMIERRRNGFTGDKLFMPPNKLKYVELYKKNVLIKSYKSMLELSKDIGGDIRGWYRLASGEYKKYKGYTLKIYRHEPIC